MLRDKNLIPLSHQHQHALALCVRMNRAQPIEDRDLEAWRTELVQIFQMEIGIHFSAEEELIFPAASRFRELAILVEELKVEHASLREMFAQAQVRNLSAKDLRAFSEKLSAHIRKEERVLFENLQQLMNASELKILGEKLNLALAHATQVCAIRPKAKEESSN
ncbi:MAG TPA: hemerythrin domain-containing protein [Verrucomicrobiae bacterium]|jgi:iron-sulfur cluster repair protein YtfE (RIC family)|nr:hemerythrin domain-containing protein [Verrucomicrobiae bacterium]